MLAAEALMWKDSWQRGTHSLSQGESTNPWMEGGSYLAGNLEGSARGQKGP